MAAHWRDRFALQDRNRSWNGTSPVRWWPAKSAGVFQAALYDREQFADLSAIKQEDSMMTRSGSDRRTRIAAVIVPVVLFGQMMALAADGPLLAAAAAAVEILATILVLLLVAPPSTFWRRLAPPLAVLGLAAVWLASGTMPGIDLLHRGWIAPDLNLGGVVRYIGGVAVLVAAAAVAWRPGGARVSLDAWIMVSLILLAAGFAMNEADPSRVWGYDKGFLAGRFTGTILNANAAGCLFGILAVLGLGRFLTLLPRRLDPAPLPIMIAAPVALLAGIGACAITASRTALAATLVALLLATIFDQELREQARQRTRYVVLLLAALAIGVAVMLFLVGDVVSDRFQTVSTDGIERTRIWAFYGRIVLAHPWGVGPGGLDDITLHALSSTTDAARIWFVHSPHNLFLSLLLVGGWPYLMLILTAAGLLAWPAIRSSAIRRQPMIRASISAIGVILACASVDITLDIPAFASLAAFLIGTVWGGSVRQPMTMA